MYSFLIPSPKLLYKIFLFQIIIAFRQLIDNSLILNQLHADNFILVIEVLFTAILCIFEVTINCLQQEIKIVFSLKIIISLIESFIH